MKIVRIRQEISTELWWGNPLKVSSWNTEKQTVNGKEITFSQLLNKHLALKTHGLVEV
jgi:hypothetical protein